MTTPTSTDPDRVCDTCERTAAPHDYFCHRCTTHLPDPADHVPHEVRPRVDTPATTIGWPVLTVLGVVLVVGAIIAGAVVAVGRLDPFTPDPHAPRAVVHDYYRAVQEGDCAAADDLEVEVYRAPERCEHHRVVLAGTDDTDLRVEDELVLDRHASIRIRDTLDGGTHERCTPRPAPRRRLADPARRARGPHPGILTGFTPGRPPRPRGCRGSPAAAHGGRAPRRPPRAGPASATSRSVSAPGLEHARARRRWSARAGRPARTACTRQVGRVGPRRPRSPG